MNKKENSQETGKCQGDQGKKGGWENKPIKFSANLGVYAMHTRFNHKQHTESLRTELTDISPSGSQTDPEMGRYSGEI